MNEIRERLEAHRFDVLVLLQEISKTAALHDGFRLAETVGHIARAQVLIAEELFGLPGESKETGAREPAGTREDDTPIEGLRPR